MKRRRFCLSVACGTLLLAIIPSSAAAPIIGSFQWDDTTGRSDPDKPLNVYFRAPATIGPDTPIWFVMHGASRNADDYRNYLGGAPAAADALVIAPEFSSEDWSGSRRYNLGNVAVSESDLTARPRQDWAFSKIEPLFDYVRTTIAPQVNADRYSMYGHSAGAQFVHRYLMWEPEARVNVAVAANAGWYTLPTEPEPADGYPHEWPYSLANAPDYDPATPTVDPIPVANVENAFEQRLVVLLGEDDMLRTSSLRQTTEADDQGPHRFARGQFYYNAAQAEADRLGLAFNWGMQFVPEVAHSGQEMALPAAEIMRLAEASPGDFNGDGAINTADYEVWRTAYGTRPLVPGLGPDGNGDGSIDAADYAVWRDAMQANAGAIVPTPSGGLLAILAIIGVAADRLVKSRHDFSRGIGLVTIACSGAVSSAEVTLFFGGDTSLGENYQRQYAENGGEDILATRGYDYSFERVTHLAEGADLAVLNLETPLTTRKKSPLVGKDYYHWSDPDRALPSLRRLGIDAVSLANNHTLDYGSAGLIDTLNALREAKIASFGAGRDAAQAGEAFITEFDDPSGRITVAIIGAFHRKAVYEAYNFYATDDLPGANPLDPALLAEQIAAVRRHSPEAFVIVTPHWGKNYVWRSEAQRRQAEAIVAAGADLVLGHGAHRLQEIERIDGCWVFYSIGNYVFNSAGRFKKLDSPPYSLPVRVRLSRNDKGSGHVAIRGYPIFSDNRITGYQPRPVTDAEAQEVRELLRSHDVGNHLQETAEWSRDEIGARIEVTGHWPSGGSP